MCQCNNGGCSACSPQDVSPLHFIASGKEIEELYMAELDKDYPEDLWVDSGELNLEDYSSGEAEGNATSSKSSS